MAKYPIVKCPDCGIKCNFIANSFAEMPSVYPGDYYPHQRGSKSCLQRQLKNLRNELNKFTK